MTGALEVRPAPPARPRSCRDRACLPRVLGLCRVSLGGGTAQWKALWSLGQGPGGRAHADCA